MNLGMALLLTLALYLGVFRQWENWIQMIFVFTWELFHLKTCSLILNLDFLFRSDFWEIFSRVRSRTDVGWSGMGTAGQLKRKFQGGLRTQLYCMCVTNPVWRFSFGWPFGERGGWKKCFYSKLQKLAIGNTEWFKSSFFNKVFLIIVCLLYFDAQQCYPVQFSAMRTCSIICQS